MESELPVEEIDFQKYWLVLKRQWKVVAGSFVLITLAALFYGLKEDTVYQAESKLLFKSDRSTSLTGLGEPLGQIESLTFEANPLDTQVQVIQSRPILETVIQNLNIRDEDGQLLDPGDISKHLQVKALAGTDVVSILYSSEDPEISALVANTIADVFIQENIQKNRVEATSARDFISQQLPQTEAALRQAEVNLKEFKERNGVVSLAQEASSLVDAAFELQSQINAVESQIVNINSIIESHQSQLNIGNSQYAIVLAALSESEGVQQVLRDLQTVEQEIAANSALFTPTSQTISRLIGRRENLQKILSERIGQVVNGREYSGSENLQIGALQISLVGQMATLDAQRKGLTNQIDTLNLQMARYGQRMSTLPDLEKQQSELERDLAVAKETYQSLLSRFQELQIAESQNVGNVRLMSGATIPEFPIPSNKKLMLLTGMVVGGLVGVALAFLLDILDDSVKTIKEAKDIFGYPVLCTIPKTSAVEEAILNASKERRIPSVITRDLTFSPSSEFYRILQANLKAQNSDQATKIIAVTSSVFQEGKSEIAANLAVVMAQVGCKVLLVDADFRNSLQDRIWDLSSFPGLSHVLSDQMSFKDAAQAVMPGLWVLTAGSIAPNPIVLLDSDKMRTLLDDLRLYYDYIIVDTSPLLGFADTNVIGKMVDGMLLIVRPGLLNTAKAKLAKEIINQFNHEILGMIINGVVVRQEEAKRNSHSKDHGKAREASHSPGKIRKNTINRF